jgi:hypothetical protein
LGTAASSSWVHQIVSRRTQAAQLVGFGIFQASMFALSSASFRRAPMMVIATTLLYQPS